MQPQDGVCCPEWFRQWWVHAAAMEEEKDNSDGDADSEQGEEDLEISD